MFNPSKIYNYGLGLLSLINYVKGGTVGWYLVSLVYNDLLGKIQRSNNYGDVYIGVTVPNC